LQSKSVRARPGSSAGDEQRVLAKVDLEPLITDEHKDTKASRLLTKTDEYDLPTPPWKCREALVGPVDVA